MSYEYITRITSPNHSGKRPGKIKGITLHWWGDPNHFGESTKDADAENIAHYLSRKNGTSSAHYVVTGGKVYCIVDPDNVAWHAGVWERNLDQIGIECDADLQDSMYGTVAELVKELRKTYGNLPLNKHRDWKNTACPGPLDLDRVQRLATRKPVGKPKPVKPAPKPPVKKPVKPRPPVKVESVLKVGSSGVKVKALQNKLNTNYPSYSKLVVDGKFGPATERVVKEFQERSGLVADGIVGPLTRKALGL